MASEGVPGVFSHTKILMLIFLMAGLVVGGGATYLAMNTATVSADDAGQVVASTLENQTGVNYEVVNVEEQSGMYRVQVSVNNQLQTYFVTKDGKLLANQLTDIEQVRNLMADQRQVSNCLEDEGAVLYGNLSQQATVAQIQVLGGADNVAPFYSDVNNPQNLVEAVQRGVTSVPGFWLDNQTLSGPANMNQIRDFAGCQQ